MQPKTISYGRTYSNGNYEFSRIDFTVDIEPGDNVDECYEDLYNWVHETRIKELQLIKEQEKKNDSRTR